MKIKKLKNRALQYHPFIANGEWIPVYFRDSRIGKEWDALCKKLMSSDKIPDVEDYEQFIKNIWNKK